MGLGCGSPFRPHTAPTFSTPPLHPQAELMSSLIEYCIELNQAAEAASPQESLSGLGSAPGSLQPPTQRPQLRRQGSVVCSRLQHLSTIDYVEEGEQPLCGTHAYTCAFAGSRSWPGVSRLPSSVSRNWKRLGPWQ